MKKRGLAAFLACVMLAGCGANQTQTAVEPPAVDGPVIAYVPLDDRPDNAERVVYLANSLNYQLEMPEEDWYQTKLDAQPLNENGTQYGDRATGTGEGRMRPLYPVSGSAAFRRLGEFPPYQRRKSGNPFGRTGFDGERTVKRADGNADCG